MFTLRRNIRNIALVLLAAAYFAPLNGILLQDASRWYSADSQPAIALHNGPSREVPPPSLAQRIYLPLTTPLTLLPVALLAHFVVYPAGQRLFFTRTEDNVPCSGVILSSTLTGRAPPTV